MSFPETQVYCNWKSFCTTDLLVLNELLELLVTISRIVPRVYVFIGLEGLPQTGDQRHLESLFYTNSNRPGPGTSLSGVHCGIQKSAAVSDLDMGRTACGTRVCFCSGRFFRALLESAKSCAYGDLRAQALPERVSRS